MLSLPSSAQFLRASLLLTFVTIASCGTILALNAQDEGARPFFVEGYAGKVSYAPGEGLELHVSTSAKQFSIEVARVGATRQTVFQKNGIPGMESPIPENASSHGCQWPMAFHMPIPSDWKSGYYEVKLKIADDGGKYAYRGKRTAESSCYFVLRASKPGASSPILMQLATNTYNAYNNWGGFSLYAFNGRAGVQGNRVSFHRPPQSQYSRWEQAFCSWAESQGYVLEYAANSDLEFHPEILAGYQLVLSVGHDEYWSAPMRDHLEAFIASGKNVAFFSGNTCCWQVRSEDQGNALVSWKQRYVMDPIYPSKDHRLLSTLWSHHLVARPENQLTGVGFLFGGYHRSHGQFMDGSGAYTVHRPDHWLLDGTQLKKDDSFGGKDTIVGYECDGCEIEWKDGLPFPTYRDGTPQGFQIVATAPAKWHPDDAYFYDRFEQGRVGAAVVGAYTRGGTVITVGSTDWAHGLAGKDVIVEKITRNVLDKLSKVNAK
ncbi:MAG: DUF6605 domain-containing protein [Pirellulales bacterium]